MQLTPNEQSGDHDHNLLIVTFVACEYVSDDLIDPFPSLFEQNRLPREYKVDQANGWSACYIGRCDPIGAGTEL